MSAPAIAASEVTEFFPALAALEFVRHGFVRRIPGLDVATDRAAALARLAEIHSRIRDEFGFGKMPFATAEQVHGDSIAVIDQPLRADHCLDGVDGLITNRPNVSLGIYVADCCAVFLVDPAARAIGLVHSGRKGTELGIVTKVIEKMQEAFAAQPDELIIQLSPCIRPPHYEVDFAAEIVRQARAAGARAVHDNGHCTACDLQNYYSYRAERARTGRMLALLAIRGF